MTLVVRDRLRSSARPASTRLEPAASPRASISAARANDVLIVGVDAIVEAEQQFVSLLEPPLPDPQAGEPGECLGVQRWTRARR